MTQVEGDMSTALVTRSRIVQPMVTRSQIVHPVVAVVILCLFATACAKVSKTSRLVGQVTQPNTINTCIQV